MGDSPSVKQSNKKQQAIDFETAMSELETLISNLESGELGLEESLQTFEKGVKLTRECQQQLSQAEQRVTQLIEENNALNLVGFDDGDN